MLFLLQLLLLITPIRSFQRSPFKDQLKVRMDAPKSCLTSSQKANKGFRFRLSLKDDKTEAVTFEDIKVSVSPDETKIIAVSVPSMPSSILKSNNEADDDVVRICMNVHA